MSSPSIFILGVGCIVNNLFSEWVCSYLGVAEHLWVAGVVPSFIVYHMCDRSRLKSAARALFRFSADLRTLVSVLSVGLIALVSVYFKLALWMLLAMAGCMYFLVMSFSAEKTMYIGDWCGAVAKQVFREVMMNFICEAAWMKMKGEWHFCSPYSRHMEVKSTDHYYTLKKPAPIDSSNATSFAEEEEFTVCFPIEECEVFCKFQYLMKRRNGTERKDAPDKVEVSLLYKRKPLEEYTYLNVPTIRVARLKRLITVLKEEGNLVLSDVHKNVGSEFNLAHARCYEFEEMLKLVLSEDWTLKKINLGAEYKCSISGSSLSRGTATGLVFGLLCCVICSLGREA